MLLIKYKSCRKDNEQRTLITEQWNNLERFIENSEAIRDEMSSREQSRDESQSNLKQYSRVMRKIELLAVRFDEYRENRNVSFWFGING